MQRTGRTRDSSAICSGPGTLPKKLLQERMRDGENVDSSRGKGKALDYDIVDPFPGNLLSVHFRCTFPRATGNQAVLFKLDMASL